jgi:hypothetical protein
MQDNQKAIMNMSGNDDVNPNAPAGGGGPGGFRSALALGQNPGMDSWQAPSLKGHAAKVSTKLTISGVIVAGGDLSKATIVEVNAAAAKTHEQWRRYIAYLDIVKVGGSLAWRANNPGNLRSASTSIGSVPGAVGHFAVFATFENGRAAQRALYLEKYGAKSVRAAIDKLTPPSENDTENYLAQLQAAGVKLDQNVKSQIDLLMKAVEANEGLIEGIIVSRVP